MSRSGPCSGKVNQTPTPPGRSPSPRTHQCRSPAPSGVRIQPLLTSGREDATLAGAMSPSEGLRGPPQGPPRPPPLRLNTAPRSGALSCGASEGHQPGPHLPSPAPGSHDTLPVGRGEQEARGAWGVGDPVTPCGCWLSSTPSGPVTQGLPAVQGPQIQGPRPGGVLHGDNMPRRPARAPDQGFPGCQHVALKAQIALIMGTFQALESGADGQTSPGPGRLCRGCLLRRCATETTAAWTVLSDSPLIQVGTRDWPLGLLTFWRKDSKI